MRAYLLLDRSGSMGTLWHEAIGSVNGYVMGLPMKAKVRVDIFDSVNPYGQETNGWYETLRDTTVSDYKQIDVHEASPRGGTPLNDAAGKLLNEVLTLKDKKVVVVIMTDGFENTSKEFTLANVKDLIKKVEAKGYEVIMLGADFKEAEQQAASYGFAVNKTMNISKGSLEGSMRGLADMSTMYFSGATASMNLDAATKAAAVSK